MIRDARKIIHMSDRADKTKIQPDNDRKQILSLPVVTWSDQQRDDSDMAQVISMAYTPCQV